MNKLTSTKDLERALRLGDNFTLDDTLINLDLSGVNIDSEGARILAKVLEDNTTLQNLSIDLCFPLGGASNLIEALKKNISLTRLNIRDRRGYLDEYANEEWQKVLDRLFGLVEKNKEQRAMVEKATKKCEEAFAEKLREEKLAKEREEVRKQQLEEKHRKQQEEERERLERHNAWQARRLQEEEEARQRASLKAWIEGNNWEAVAAFIKEHSDFAITNFLAAGKYNLNTVTFINQLSAHAVQLTIEEFEVAQTTLATKDNELSTQHQLLEQEEQDLKNRLEKIGAKMKQVAEEIQAVKKDLDVKPKQIIKAKENLKAIQDSLADNVPKLKQWKERLQIDVRQWTDQDVEFLLRELDMANHAATFTKNKIDGSVLLDLTTSDLIDTLNVTFKEAKRLLKSVFLARIYKDIYTNPPGVLQWHVDTVCSWLEDNKFAHLTDIFRKQQITGSELAFIDRNDLKKYLKIEALGDCIKLEKVIKELQQSHLADRSAIQKEIAEKSELEDKLDEMKAINEELKQKLKEAKRDAPEAFNCPITQEIMSDPVVASDGHTYERVAIEAWLLKHDTSPMTNQRLESKTLTPSHTLKSMIREFVDRK